MGDGFECVICQDCTQLTLGVLDGCPHAFCFGCIDNWLKSASVCPTCKAPVTRLHRYKLPSPIQGKTSAQDIKDAIVSQGPPVETLRIEERKLRSDHFDDDLPVESDDEGLEYTLCDNCGVDENDHLLLLCDGCNLGFHTYCCGLDDIPQGDWFCPFCTSNGSASRAPSTARRGARRSRGRRSAPARAHQLRSTVRARSASRRRPPPVRQRTTVSDFIVSDSDSDSSDGSYDAPTQVTTRRNLTLRNTRNDSDASHVVDTLRRSWNSVRNGQADFPSAAHPLGTRTRASSANDAEEDVALAFRLADMAASRATRRAASVRERRQTLTQPQVRAARRNESQRPVREAAQRSTQPSPALRRIWRCAGSSGDAVASSGSQRVASTRHEPTMQHTSHSARAAAGREQDSDAASARQQSHRLNAGAELAVNPLSSARWPQPPGRCPGSPPLRVHAPSLQAPNTDLAGSARPPRRPTPRPPPAATPSLPPVTGPATARPVQALNPFKRPAPAPRGAHDAATSADEPPSSAQPLKRPRIETASHPAAQTQPGAANLPASQARALSAGQVATSVEMQRRSVPAHGPTHREVPQASHSEGHHRPGAWLPNSEANLNLPPAGALHREGPQTAARLPDQPRPFAVDPAEGPSGSGRDAAHAPSAAERTHRPAAAAGGVGRHDSGDESRRARADQQAGGDECEVLSTTHASEAGASRAAGSGDLPEADPGQKEAELREGMHAPARVQRKAVQHFASRLMDKCLRHHSSWEQLDPHRLSRIMRDAEDTLTHQLMGTCAAAEREHADIAKAALKGAHQANILTKEQWKKAYTYLRKQIAEFLQRCN